MQRRLLLTDSTDQTRRSRHLGLRFPKLCSAHWQGRPAPSVQHLWEGHLHQEVAARVRDVESVAGRVRPCLNEFGAHVRDATAGLKIGSLYSHEFQPDVIVVPPGWGTQVKIEPWHYCLSDVTPLGNSAGSFRIIEAEARL